MGQNSFVIGLTLAVLFAVAIFAFANGFIENNNGYINIDNRSTLEDANASARGNISSFVVQQNGSVEAFGEYTIGTGSQAHETGGVFKTESNYPKLGITSILNLIKAEIFGGDPAFAIVFGTIAGLIALVGVTLAWKAWYGGNPE